jgi:serine/threonine-protein kinase
LVCIGEEALARYLAGDLEFDAHARAELHVAECAACSAMLNELTMRTEVRAVGDEPRARFLKADTNVKDKVMWLERHYGLQIGDVVAGKYEIEKVIGEGGMGIVVRATHRALRQKVALKFMHPSMAKNPAHAARFIREARAAVRLREEHVARVLDLGDVDDTGPYIVMEYLEGVDLLAYLKKNAPLQVAEAIELIRQACSGVAAAHEAGIVHRDLKPGNMFITEKRDRHVLKVLDFGVSKYLDGDSLAVTGTNMVVGSPMYMAPELFETARNATPASDVWALGVIFYRMLTGRLPFFGESLPELVAKVHFGAPTPIVHWRPELPPEVCQILDGCFHREPSRRFGNARELLAAVTQLPAVVRAHQSAPTTAVRKLEREQPSPTRPPTSEPSRQRLPTHSGDWVGLPPAERRSRPWLFAIIGAAVASALFGGILVATSAGGGEPAAAPETETETEAETATEATPDPLPAPVVQPDAAVVISAPIDAVAPEPEPVAAEPTAADPEPTTAELRRKRRTRERKARERRERERRERRERDREAQKERETKEPVLLIPDKKDKRDLADDEEE